MKSIAALGWVTRGFRRALLVGCLLSVAAAFPASAQETTPAGEPSDPAEPAEPAEPTTPESSEEAEIRQWFEKIETFGWERSGKGKLGTMAEIAIPEGFRFTGKEGTRKLMEEFGNIPTEIELGTLAPEDLDWFVVFEFDKIGYVKDDEKDEIDADELLKVFRENQRQANQQRIQLGMGTLTVVGWAKKPFYNEATNNLEWALELRDQDGIVSINYRTKLLGRHGVMESVLVCDGPDLQQLLPVYQNLIADYSFNDGHTYAEFRSGDKIAEYGLKGLIVGGGIFAAAKLGLFGLLKKFWYVVVAGIAGIGGLIKRLFGGGKNQYTTEQ